ncbi:MAG: diphosphomevalonate decarboxylase [Halodesulfurarchaeum sp.]|nr:diphosphomevalonate decarboxylase [Halodesulfurarchaeum sp.]
MKATAVAHPIQGLLKYHGFRDPSRNVPAHDSISVCTAPSRTTTTVEFGHDADSILVDGEPIDEEGAGRAREVLDLVRGQSGLDSGARVVSENTFESNVGLGASASAYAALARAAADAAGLDPSRAELSRLARRGAASAARSVVGGFAHLKTQDAPEAAVAKAIPAGFDADIRIVIASLPERKYTSRAHATTPDSPYFEARLAGVHETSADLRRAIRTGDFEATFAIAERESIELLGVTMTGPEGWLYWRPETLAVLETARNLRENGVPVYFSADTGATAYLNTTAEYVETVRQAIEDEGIPTRVWRVGGGVEVSEEHLF